MSLPQSPETHARPDDGNELESAMAQAMRVLEEAGMTVQDLLDELPALIYSATKWVRAAMPPC